MTMFDLLISDHNIILYIEIIFGFLNSHLQATGYPWTDFFV
jgi:hypothetical protein